MMLSAVPKQVVDVVWEDVKRVLEPAVKTAKGKLSIKDVYEYIKSGFYELWVVMDGTKIIAVITTRVIEYPERRALAMDFIGGRRMKEWLPMAQRTIEKFAKENNCFHLEGYGRRAWKKWLDRYGWKQEYIAYRMELNGQ